ncbi:hypothetical protein NEMBOFW57_007682 [Staphylotrichum longicolle]|uniref:Uncharacterized protein n=1 Tax=Staphylotrichum longicolle TaxID=669026 RepID=A0AAD4EYQ1_9PEZI|nr:hypothetical protein NEMBOFW57_007682 [Staphylotrichum longicolle]
MAQKTLDSPDHYTVGWIAALPIERAAATALLDEVHGKPPDEGIDIRLGDVVVSQPDGNTGGVVQYDLVKAKSDGEREPKGFLNMPPAVLLNALSNLQANHEMEEPLMNEFLSKMLTDKPRMARAGYGYIHQGFEHDQLFNEECDTVPRPARNSTDPVVHYGIIASGNTLVKDAAERDRIAKHVGGRCLCVEMEAAGLMNHFPCLVVRGISDYADSHKNDRWQRYASATAAAFGKELLSHVPVSDLQQTRRAVELLESILSATILDHLDEARLDSVVCLEFFFDFSDKNKQHLDDLLRSLAFQLYLQCSDARERLDALFTRCNIGQTQPTTAALSCTIQEMMQRSSKVLIVLDALDESVTRTELLGWMRTLASPDLTHVHVVATSRREQELESGLSAWIGEDDRVPLEKDPVNEDIRSFRWAALDPWEDYIDSHPNEVSPLYMASLNGLNVTVQTLLQRGAEVNASSGFHGNALLAASYRGHSEVVQVLLENGAEVDSESLEYARSNGHTEIFQMLARVATGGDAQEGGLEGDDSN